MEDLNAPGPIWACKIGIRGECPLPGGADSPMRQAVERAFRDVTGIDPEFTFSGWSESLTEPELAVVENRLPDEAHYRAERIRDAAPDLLEALKHTAELLAGANRSTDRPSDHISRRVMEARAAISKATQP